MGPFGAFCGQKMATFVRVVKAQNCQQSLKLDILGFSKAAKLGKIPHVLAPIQGLPKMARETRKSSCFCQNSGFVKTQNGQKSLKFAIWRASKAANLGKIPMFWPYHGFCLKGTIMLGEAIQFLFIGLEGLGFGVSGLGFRVCQGTTSQKQPKRTEKKGLRTQNPET